MPKYRKKPVVIEALCWDGSHESYEEIQNFCAKAKYRFIPNPNGSKRYLVIPTLEGDMRAEPGDWIIKGLRGEFYPCKPDVFEKSYEEVEE